ncbi:MAG: hypothetical protein H6617_08780 [Bdellovibrionaceae bacterium]|nr:hypothetical protein [Bdellovibrionales bacterium]MCB9254761.1 hypothetical protein [Pseudobdellovibrionaceae bacterium]
MSEFFAGWLPGLPQLLQGDKSEAWKRIAGGMETLGTHLKEFRPDVLVLYSSQWLSVLGTSFQVQQRPKGVHVDENWHEWGDLEFDFPVDAELGKFFASALKVNGLPSKTVDFEGFPIDTGTIVANRFLNPEGKIPLSIVSSWVYADAEKSRQIGRLVREECSRRGVRAAYVACSLLSAHYTPKEIKPAEDCVSASDDEWNQKFLNTLESGDLSSFNVGEYAKAVGADMQLNAFHWLSGVLEERETRAQIHAYGPIWGAGAAVLEFRGEGVGC